MNPVPQRSKALLTTARTLMHQGCLLSPGIWPGCTDGFLWFLNAIICSGFKLDLAWRLSSTALLSYSDLAQNVYCLLAIHVESFPKWKMTGTSISNTSDLMKSQFSFLNKDKEKKSLISLFPILLENGI